MADEVLEKIVKRDDPLLQEQKGYSTEVEPSVVETRPDLFTGLKSKIIKSVSLYLQLLWDDCPNGKIIKVIDLITNSKTLFGTRFESKDIYVIRHIASDLREISLFIPNMENGIKKYFKNIDVTRADISARLDLIRELQGYLSEVVHMNYSSSYEQSKKISKLINDLDKKNINIPDQFDNYFQPIIFNNIFENFCIIFVFNFYKIFSEFLYDDKE